MVAKNMNVNPFIWDGTLFCLSGYTEAVKLTKAPEKLGLDWRARRDRPCDRLDRIAMIGNRVLFR